VNVYLKAGVIIAMLFVGAALLFGAIAGWLWLAIFLGRKYGEPLHYFILLGPFLVCFYVWLVRDLKRRAMK
jgi:hypothetical protein